MRAMRAPVVSAAHMEPETLARFVDGRETPAAALHHLRECELCRARASDARLLRALIAGAPGPAATTTTIPLDSCTVAGYHDQGLPPDQMAAVDRRLLRDDAALLELIELRLGLNAARRAHEPDAHLVAQTAAAFSTGQSPRSQRIASLGTLIIVRGGQVPMFHFHSATPEGIASSRAATGNDSGSYPAPAPRREQTLHAGRHSLRVRIAPDARLEFFVFDEQHFRPANGVQVACEPERGQSIIRGTSPAGFVAIPLPEGHARVLIDAGDRWLLELR